MLKNLFGEPKHARAPEGARLYAVGDIHGCAELLDRLMAKVAAEEKEKGPAQLIFLGDYVDRGPDSRGVIERLIAIGAERPDATFLCGNHEAALLDFLGEPAENADWLDWGGDATLASYGVVRTSSRDAADLAADLAARMSDAHLDFFERLELYRIVGDYLFVHAGVRPGRPLEDQEARDLLWIRREFHDAPADQRPAQVVVHGHQPLRKPLDAGWRIDVDTGACFSGHLTAVVLEGSGRRFIST